MQNQRLVDESVELVSCVILSVPETVTRLEGVTKSLVEKFLGGQS